MRREIARVYRHVDYGQLESSEGSHRVFMLAQIGKLIELIEVEVRVNELERVASDE